MEARHSFTHPSTHSHSANLSFSGELLKSGPRAFHVPPSHCNPTIHSETRPPPVVSTVPPAGTPPPLNGPPWGSIHCWSKLSPWGRSVLPWLLGNNSLLIFLLSGCLSDHASDSFTGSSPPLAPHRLVLPVFSRGFSPTPPAPGSVRVMPRLGSSAQTCRECQTWHSQLLSGVSSHLGHLQSSVSQTGLPTSASSLPASPLALKVKECF